MTAKRKRAHSNSALREASAGERRLEGLCCWTTDGFAAVDVKAAELRMPRGSRRMGKSLGFDFKSRAAVIEHIKRGFEVASIEHLSNAMQISTQQLAEVVSIAKRTLARRMREGKLQAAESEKVYRIAAVFDRAVQVLGDAEHARQWLKTPKKALRGQSPLQHSDTEVGAREVEDLLGRLEHGVFS